MFPNKITKGDSLTFEVDLPEYNPSEWELSFHITDRTTLVTVLAEGMGEI